MLVKPPLEELLPHVENRYTLAITIAKRTRQLVSGAQPMAESESPNLVTLACEELAADKIAAVPQIVDPVVPLRPEVEEERLRAEREAEESARALNDLQLMGEDYAKDSPKSDLAAAIAADLEKSLEAAETEEVELTGEESEDESGELPPLEE